MFAAAKINLDLRITGRRDDGYHLLDSIVGFADIGDEVTAKLSDGLSLEISGPFAADLENGDNNLILKAARLVCAEAGVKPDIKFHLIKNLPVASGIGGGSADAAAAIRLAVKILSLDLDKSKLDEIALKIGADVPVCLRSKISHMSGIGDKITDIDFSSQLHMVLVNPGFSVSTPDIFKYYTSLNIPFDTKREFTDEEIHSPLIIDILKGSRNSLENAACENNKGISEVLKVLDDSEGVLLSRMTGSGATCFALYKTQKDCRVAAQKLNYLNKNWWIKAAIIR